MEVTEEEREVCMEGSGVEQATMVSYSHETHIQQSQFLLCFTYLNIQTIPERLSFFFLTMYFSFLLNIAQIFFRSPMSQQVTNISDRRRHGASVLKIHSSPDVHTHTHTH